MGALKIMDLMQLGKIEKGSLSMDAKFNSLSARWFGCSRGKTGKDIDDKDHVEGDNDNNKFIKRDSRITLKCQWGGILSIDSGSLTQMPLYHSYNTNSIDAAPTSLLPFVSFFFLLLTQPVGLLSAFSMPCGLAHCTCDTFP